MSTLYWIVILVETLLCMIRRPIQATTGITPCFEEFNEECQEALEKLKEEKKRTKEIEEEKEERKSKGEFWWDEPIDNMGLRNLRRTLKPWTS